MRVEWVSTTESQPWETRDKSLFATSGAGDDLEVTGEQDQCIDGFGGCFNELGWIALLKLDEDKRNMVMRSLFDSEDGCGFSFCRVPIGANDYAEDWYSHNEHDGDYEMEHFSIERDKEYLIPYIKKAMEWRPDLRLFASPWSPPTWMRFPRAYNFGRLRMEPEILSAYALYFKRFIEEYRAQGIDIAQIHVQNEPFADQKFPSCLWSSEQFRVFIRDYLGPLFEKEGISTEIWFSTLNGPEQRRLTQDNDVIIQLYDEYVDHVLFDRETRKYIAGVGYQWAGQHVIQRTRESFPELKLMQTESECGDGNNTWEYARYVFNLMRHYFANGVSSYIYWNMVAEPGGMSTWGWRQNSLITVDPKTKEVTFNPEYYLMKHFSAFVLPGAVRLKVKGHWSGSALAFQNPNGEVIVVVSNSVNYQRAVTVKSGNNEFTVLLSPYSFSTFRLVPSANESPTIP